MEPRGGGNQKIDVSPIKIEFGTLELKIGDLSRVLDSNEVASRLLNNSAFVDNIVKEIGIVLTLVTEKMIQVINS